MNHIPYATLKESGFAVKKIKKEHDHERAPMFLCDVYYLGKKVGSYWPDAHGGENDVDITPDAMVALRKFCQGLGTYEAWGMQLEHSPDGVIEDMINWEIWRKLCAKKILYRVADQPEGEWSAVNMQWCPENRSYCERQWGPIAEFLNETIEKENGGRVATITG